MTRWWVPHHRSALARRWRRSSPRNRFARGAAAAPSACSNRSRDPPREARRRRRAPWSVRGTLRWRRRTPNRVVLHREVGVEHGERQPAAGPQGAGDAGGARPRPPQRRSSCRTRPGTGRSPRRTRPRTSSPWHRAVRRSPRRGALRLATSMKRSEMSTPWVAIPRRASSWACRPGPHPTSSTRIPGATPEHRGHVVDLLPCALRVRVAQVRLTEVVGDRLEPVLTHRPSAASR